jgi:glucokinase
MESKCSIGIGLNLFDARAVVLRDDRKVIAQIQKKRNKVDANETIEVLIELFEEVIAEARKDKKNIARVGVALGGIVHDKGIVYWPQKQKSTYVYIALPLQEYLEKKFGFPVILENDANACAFAEHQLNFSRHEDMLYMFSGVGMGIVINGKLYRGKDGAAGELFINLREAHASCLGDLSFLKKWHADLDMVKKAKELIARGEGTSLIKRITSTGELSLADIFEEAKKDKLSRGILKEAATALAAKISFLVNMLNPEVVVIGGGLEEAPDFFLDDCIACVKDFTFSEMRKNLKLTYSALGRNATVLGAAMLALDDL